MNVKRTIVALLGVAVLLSCGGGDVEAVRKVAKGYLDATANYDIDGAYQYASSETCYTLDVIKNYMLPQLDTSYIGRNTPAKIVVKEINIDSDTVAHAVYHKSTPIKQYDDTLCLVKRDGEWKAYVKMAEQSEAIVTMPSETDLSQYEKHKGEYLEVRPSTARPQ